MQAIDRASAVGLALIMFGVMPYAVIHTMNDDRADGSKAVGEYGTMHDRRTSTRSSVADVERYLVTFEDGIPVTVEVLP